MSTRARTIAPRQAAEPAPVRSGLLQRCACGGKKGPTGECAACRRKRLLQPKLVMNAPGDRYEREADRVADAVMRMPEAGASSPLRVQRVEAGAGYESAEAPPVVHEAIRSPGRPLDGATRASMEARLGHDFSSVRVHTDARAAVSAQAMGARAYTVGRDVVFGGGEYAPGTAAGRGLLAHELVHVAQQREGVPDGLQRQALEYDTDAITTRPPTQPFTLKDAQDLIDAEKKAKTLTSATVAGTLAPAGSNAELFLLHLIAQLASTDRWGSVADLVVQIGWPPAAGKPAPTGLVTVTFDAQGNATAELLSTTPVAAPTTHPDKNKAIEAIKKTYGIADVTAATGSAWTLDELNKLDGALALLPSQDRGALKGVVLERVATLPNSRAGEFDYKQEIVSGATTATNTAVLRLADSAFSGDAVGFVGDATKASPASYQTIIHEVGHVVATQTVRETTAPLHTAMAAMNAASAALNPTVEPLNQAAETLNDLVKQYNEADQAGKAELKPQVDAARADYNAKKKAYDPKKAAFDAAEKKVTALKGPAETAKNNQALLTAIETTSAARKQAATTALSTAQTAATAYAAPVKTESDGYRTAATAAGTKIDAYATALLTAGTDPAAVAQAETDAVDAVQARDAARVSLTSANAKNAALTDFAPVDAAQDAWLEALRLRSSVTGEGKALQGFVDLVLRERIAPFTEYARDNWPHEPGEFFAEAYSLWRTDPNYLKTNAKKIYDWFNAGSYR